MVRVTSAGGAPGDAGTEPEVCPVSHGQRRLWFLDQLAPGSPAYAVFECVWLLGGVDVVSMRRSLDVLVRRHEALRTVFSTVDGEPVQVVLPEGAAGDGGWDVLEVLEEVGLEEVDRLVGGWAARPFDLAVGPLVRGLLVPVVDGRWVLGLCGHHVVVDGWSMEVLLGELSACYSAFVGGGEPELPPVEDHRLRGRHLAPRRHVPRRRHGRHHRRVRRRPAREAE